MAILGVWDHSIGSIILVIIEAPRGFRAAGGPSTQGTIMHIPMVAQSPHHIGTGALRKGHCTRLFIGRRPPTSACKLCEKEVLPPQMPAAYCGRPFHKPYYFGSILQPLIF